MPLKSTVFFVGDAGGLALEIAEVEQAGLADDAPRHDFDAFEPRRMEGKNALDPDIEAYLADRESRAGTGAVLLNHDAAEGLHAELVTLDNLVVDGHGVADSEFRQVFAESLGFEGGDFREGEHGIFREISAKIGRGSGIMHPEPGESRARLGKSAASGLTFGTPGANPRAPAAGLGFRCAR